MNKSLLALAFSCCTAAAPAADVLATFIVDATPAWVVQSTSDTQFALPNIPNMPLTLEIGRRYVLTSADAGHTLEFVAGDFALGNDSVVLAQGTVVGSMEADAGVAWSDSGSEIAFTVTQDLSTALNGTVAQQPAYRCGGHPASMRAAMNILAASDVGDWELY